MNMGKSGCVGVLALSLLFSASSLAAQSTEKSVNPETMTCEEFLALDKDTQPHVVYWIDGYSQAGKEETVVIQAFERPITVVVNECKNTPKESLMQKVKNFFHRSDRNR
jgi:hypothetical protein